MRSSTRGSVNLPEPSLPAGVGPDMRVAVSIRRSPELLVAVHAVIRAGAAYVPVDPDHPAERIAYVFDIAEPICVLSRPQDHGAFPARVPIVDVDLDRQVSTTRRSPTLIGSDPCARTMLLT